MNSGLCGRISAASKAAEGPASPPACVQGARGDPAARQQNPPALLLHLQQHLKLLIFRGRCQAGVILASPQGRDRLRWGEMRCCSKMTQLRRSTSPIKETFGALHWFCSTDFSWGTETPTDRLLVVGFCQLRALDPRHKPVSAVGLPGPNTILALKPLLGFYPA